MQIIIVIHALIALSVMAVYSNIYLISINVYILHPLVIFSVYTAIFYATPKRYIVVLTSVSSFFLILLYIINFAAAKYWNDTISFSFLVSNRNVIYTELARVPFYFAVFPALLLLLLFKTYKHFLPIKTFARKNLGIFPMVPAIVVAFYLVNLKISLEVSSIWQGELIFEFLQIEPEAYNTSQSIFIPDLDVEKPSSENKNPKPNIILIHADALRADRLGIYGNPRNTTSFIDSLTESSKPQFPFSMSNCSESICGFSSVLSSNFSFKQPNENLLDILDNYGYFLNFVGAGDLGHAGLGHFFEPRLHNFLRADSHDGYYRHDDQYILDTLKKFPKYPGISSFFYIRMMSSHGLGSHPQKFQPYQPVSGNLLSVFSGGSSNEMRINDHDNFALQLDAYVKTIFSTLKDKGYLDNSIVIIFGDHGDALGEHGLYGHFQTLYQEEIHVPIIFWTSDNIELGLKTRQLATLMDIPATLLHHLNIPLPETFIGEPLQIINDEKISYLDNRRGSKGIIYSTSERIMKLIVNDKKDTKLLFDLTTDPKELIDLSNQEIKLRNKLEAFLKPKNL
jgi:glucan phosphoethanolaminetransferase (alkaline phosphatase superfamily)